MTIPADHPIIDLDTLIIDGALINAPSTGKELVHVPQPLPDLPPGLLHIPMRERFREFMVDGRAIIFGLALLPIGVGTAFVITFIQALPAIIATFVAAGKMALGVGGILLLVMLLTRKSKGPDALVLKGCNNGPTPGSHTVKLCNGRH